MTHPFVPKRDDFGRASILAVEVNDFENNTYLVLDSPTGQALLVDAAANYPAIARLLELAAAGLPEGTALRVAGILTTHRHPDHWQALAEAAATLGAPTFAGAEDAEAIPVPTDRLLHHGDVIELGGLRLDVIGLRGHTPGSVTLAVSVPEHPVRLITGDSLFPGGIGNTFGDQDAAAQLLADVTERIFRRYPNDTVFYPGHGLPSTLGRERGFLNAWRTRAGVPVRNPADDAYQPGA